MKHLAYVFNSNLTDFFLSELIYVDEIQCDFNLKRIVDNECLDGYSYVDKSLVDEINIDLIMLFDEKLVYNINDINISYSFFRDNKNNEYFVIIFYNEIEFYHISFLFREHLKSIGACLNGLKELNEILKGKIEFFV